MSEKTASCSTRQDQQATTQLLTASMLIYVDGIQCYTNTRLRWHPFNTLQALKEAVLPSPSSLEQRLAKDHKIGRADCNEMNQLVQAGYVASWFNQTADLLVGGWPTLPPKPCVSQVLVGMISFNYSICWKCCEQEIPMLNHLKHTGPTVHNVQILLSKSHGQSFPDELKALKSGRPLPSDKEWKEWQSHRIAHGHWMAVRCNDLLSWTQVPSCWFKTCMSHSYKPTSFKFHQQHSLVDIWS